MSFQSLSSELVGTIPGLDPFLADSFVNRALRDVLDARAWSFLQSDGAIVCPAQIVAGTAAITQYSATVTMSAAASAALSAVVTEPGLTKLQIRFGGAGNVSFAGQIYSILDADTTDPAAYVLTLDREVVQVTNATSGYQVYRCYVPPPVEDFLQWQSIVDMTNGWPLKRDFTSSYFDSRDPQRMAQGLGYYVGAYKGVPATASRPLYEIWPHPTAGQTFYVRFKRRGEPLFNAADTQPTMIPDQLVLLRANGWYAYPWAASNVGRFPALRGVGWVALTLDAKRMYAEELLLAKKQDDNQELQTVWSRGHGLRRGRGTFKGIVDFPIDSAWLQSHLVNF